MSSNVLGICFHLNEKINEVYDNTRKIKKSVTKYSTTPNSRYVSGAVDVNTEMRKSYREET